MGHFHQMGFVWASYCGSLCSQFDLSGLSQTSVTRKSEDTRWFKGDVIMVLFLFVFPTLSRRLAMLHERHLEDTLFDFFLKLSFGNFCHDRAQLGPGVSQFMVTAM